MIPEDKREALFNELVTNWGPTSGGQYFSFSEFSFAESVFAGASFCFKTYTMRWHRS
jgi:hypothetical protein